MKILNKAMPLNTGKERSDKILNYLCEIEYDYLPGL